MKALILGAIPMGRYETFIVHLPSGEIVVYLGALS